ncbi:MAG: hypothetical protein NTV98_00490 [Candidatus Roizmanbacteria bacterium]|nr:hypothetical protein [Candidatus Roizmanbacteria bacterium]
MENLPTADLDKAPFPEPRETNYVLTGIIVGLILSFAIVGVLYFKSLSKPNPLKIQEQATTGAGQTNETTANPSGISASKISPTVQPTVTPVKVNSQIDLIKQQTDLDVTDMKGVLTDLEKNSRDSLQFAQ